MDLVQQNGFDILFSFHLPSFGQTYITLIRFGNKIPSVFVTILKILAVSLYFALRVFKLLKL